MSFGTTRGRALSEMTALKKEGKKVRLAAILLCTDGELMIVTLYEQRVSERKLTKKEIEDHDKGARLLDYFYGTPEESAYLESIFRISGADRSSFLQNILDNLGNRVAELIRN